MDDLDYDIIEDLFCRCLEKKTDEQLIWLRKHCNKNEKLFYEVASLLKAHNDSSDFLSTPIQFETLDSNLQNKIRQPDSNKYIGKKLGAYQIDRLLGKGGMGYVYLAHRYDGEYEREVAIKIVEFSHLESLQFKRERQILAQLQHPNIVTLLDGGSFDNNSGSYFIMERIKGLNIDEYIKVKQLSTKQIVQLLIQLGNVLHDAHQHGVIHCDIKPANIMINEDGILKLLDFGISQLLNTPQQEGSLTKNFALTPEYASPRRHQQLPPMISDDIFSLGILLSHILSGEFPDTRISEYTAYPEPDIEKTAQHIKNYELRCIFIKATHPDEQYRYSSAKGFADDLYNWINRRPVNAVGHNMAYLLKKHIRRNWRYWSLVSILILSSITVIIVWLNNARLERESIQTQHTIEGMLDDLDKTLESLPKTVLIRKKLIEIADQRIRKHSERAPNNINIKKIQADILTRLADVTGYPYTLNQGNTEGALKLYKKALQIYESIIDSSTDLIEAEVKAADTLRRVAELIAYQGDILTGLQMLQKKRRHLIDVYNNANIPIKKRFPLIILYVVEAHGYFHLNQLDKAEASLKKAKQIASTSQPPYDTDSNLILAFMHEETGHLAFLKKQYKRAEQEYVAVIKKYQHNDLWQHQTRLARTHNGLACIALVDNETLLAQQHFQALWQAYIDLKKKYPNAKTIESRIKLYQNLHNKLKNKEKISIKELNKALHCDTPLDFMLPPVKHHK